jgi:hypothetical protein
MKKSNIFLAFFISWASVVGAMQPSKKEELRRAILGRIELTIMDGSHSIMKVSHSFEPDDSSHYTILFSNGSYAQCSCSQVGPFSQKTYCAFIAPSPKGHRFSDSEAQTIYEKAENFYAQCGQRKARELASR